MLDSGSPEFLLIAWPIWSTIDLNISRRNYNEDDVEVDKEPLSDQQLSSLGFAPMTEDARFSYSNGTWKTNANATLMNAWGGAHEQVCRQLTEKAGQTS
eukprot:SAG31_NODE_924_length_10963_cov_4.339286_9_plen_99_part_00